MKRLLLLLLLAAPMQAQTLPRELDSLHHVLDSLKTRESQIDSTLRGFNHAYRKAYHSTRWYAGVLASGVVANRVFHFDTDPGGYQDSWGTPDKWEHFSVALFLTERAEMMRVPLKYAVPLTCGAAWGFEWSQGHVSWRDGVVGCAGAVTAAGFRWLQRKAAKKYAFQP